MREKQCADCKKVLVYDTNVWPTHSYAIWLSEVMGYRVMRRDIRAMAECDCPMLYFDLKKPTINVELRRAIK